MHPAAGEGIAGSASNNCRVTTDERTAQMQKRFEVPVIIAALLVVPSMLLNRSEGDPTLGVIAYALNVAIWLVFAAELVCILWVTPNRWRWMLDNPLEPLIVIFTPPIVPNTVRAAQLLRLLRLLRVLRLAQVAKHLTSEQSLRFAAILATLTALGGGAAFASVEGRHVSTWDGIWWAISTMTTVGYGDIYPRTNEGRAIAIMVMLVGIGFIAILTAAIAQKFVATQVAATVGAAEQETIHDIDEAEAHVLAELQSMQTRLRDLEAAIRQMGIRPRPGEQ
jgi:voltage-gated potassium channel